MLTNFTDAFVHRNDNSFEVREKLEMHFARKRSQKIIKLYIKTLMKISTSDD